MTKVDFKENMARTMSGQMLDSLTVLIDGKEAYEWRKPDLSMLQSKNEVDLKGSLKRYLMGSTRGLADEDKVIDAVAKKIQSLKL